MVLPQLKKKVSVEDYLSTEMTIPEKREFVDGQIYAMSGGSDNHSRVAGELYALLVNHLRDSKCEPFFWRHKGSCGEVGLLLP